MWVLCAFFSGTISLRYAAAALISISAIHYPQHDTNVFQMFSATVLGLYPFIYVFQLSSHFSNNVCMFVNDFKIGPQHSTDVSHSTDFMDAEPG